MPQVTTASDVYAFGSVCLEVRVMLPIACEIIVYTVVWLVGHDRCSALPVYKK